MIQLPQRSSAAPRLTFVVALLLAAGRPGAPLAQVPADFPAIGATLLGDPAPGYIFLSNFAFDAALGNVPFLMVLDNSGYPVHSQQLTTPFNLDFKLQPDGHLSYCDALRFLILDDSFSVVDSVVAGNGSHTDGHELRMLPSGNALTLAWDTRTVDMRPYGGLAAAIVQDCSIQEIDPAGTVVWEWRTADHFQIADTTPDIDLTAPFIDYAHCNAVDIDTDGNLLLSSRHFDEITKIDRTTGDIIWRWGGKECANNQFTFANDYVVAAGDTLFWGFSHQHGVRRLDNGHLLLFDNGNLKDPHFSRAVEYELDEINHVATRVWEYRHAPDIASDEMGFAQRLPDGHTLVGWGGSHSNPIAVTEVEPDGNVVFELTYPDQVYSYRAFRFVYGMAAVTRFVDAPGAFDFNQPGNVTAVTMQLDAVSGSGELTVERHEYAAHDPQFQPGEVPQEVYPYRWVIRRGALAGFAGEVRFDLAELPAVTAPELATVFLRPLEGSGVFASLPVGYDAGMHQLAATLAGAGELVIGGAMVTTVADGGAAAPALLRLGQNQPNPFNRTTSLEYQVAQPGRVTLRIFDVTGAVVAVPVNGLVAAGTHRVELDAAGLTSGVYFYRLTAGGHVQTRKMIAMH